MRVVGLSVYVTVHSSVSSGFTRSGASNASRPFAMDDLIVHFSRAPGAFQCRRELIRVGRDAREREASLRIHAAAAARTEPLPPDPGGISTNESVCSSAGVGCAPSKTTRPLIATPGWSVSGTSRSWPLTFTSAAAHCVGALGAAPRPAAPMLALIVYVPGATPVNAYVPSAPSCVRQPAQPRAGEHLRVRAGRHESDREASAEARRTCEVIVPEMVAVGTSCIVMSTPVRSSLRPSAIVAAARMSVTPG